MKGSIMIIGIGQAYRGDDGIGLAVARKLRRLLDHRDDVRILDYQGDLTHLMELWGETSMVVVIDSMQSQKKPGTISFFSAHDRSLPAVWSQTSTHGAGLSEAIELSKALGKCPKALFVFGIEGEDFQRGEHLSTSVVQGGEKVLKRILLMLESLAWARVEDGK